MLLCSLNPSASKSYDAPAPRLLAARLTKRNNRPGTNRVPHQSITLRQKESKSAHREPHVQNMNSRLDRFKALNAHLIRPIRMLQRQKSKTPNAGYSVPTPTPIIRHSRLNSTTARYFFFLKNNRTMSPARKHHRCPLTQGSLPLPALAEPCRTFLSDPATSS